MTIIIKNINSNEFSYNFYEEKSRIETEFNELFSLFSETVCLKYEIDAFEKNQKLNFHLDEKNKENNYNTSSNFDREKSAKKHIESLNKKFRATNATLNNRLLKIHTTYVAASQILEKFSKTILAADALSYIFKKEYIYRKKLEIIESLLNKNSHHAKQNQTINQVYLHIQKIYSDNLLPRLNQAKKLLLNRPFHFSVKAASQKGEVMQLALTGYLKLISQQPFIASNVSSGCEVHLSQSTQIVIKQTSGQSFDEERLVANLFAMMSKDGAIPTFSFVESTPAKTIEKQLNSMFKDNELMFFSSEFPHLTNNQLVKRDIQFVSEKDRLCWKIFNQKLTPNLKDAIDRYADQNFQIKFESNSVQTLSFQELRFAYLSGSIPDSAELFITDGVAISIGALKQAGNEIIQALEYCKNISTSKMFLTPILPDQELREIYRKALNHSWKYIAGKKIIENIPFKKLLFNMLDKSISSTNNSFIKSQALEFGIENINRLMHVKWKTLSENSLPYLDKSCLLADLDLKRTSFKPYVDMIIMSDLLSNNQLLTKIFSRIDDLSVFNAIIYGEIQLLDLHSDNLGLAPIITADSERYCGLKYFVNGDESTTFNFLNIVTLFLKSELTDSSIIEFNMDGQTTKKALIDLPHLKSCLEPDWKFIFFDLNMAVAESNDLQIQIFNGLEGHLIPFRSTLLQTQHWQYSKLSEIVMTNLMNSNDRDKQVEAWIKRLDAPIRMRLPRYLCEEIDSILYVSNPFDYLSPLQEPLLQKYCFQNHKRANPSIQLKNLQSLFVQEFANSGYYVEIWSKIGKALSKDLNSASLQTTREHIAAQFFPRLTLLQQQALLERQKNRREYLNNYKNFANADISVIKDMSGFIQSYMKNKTTPLPYFTKQNCSNLLKDATPKVLEDIYNSLLNICKPSYSNLMKAMYPLLTDAYFINKVIATHSKKLCWVAGESIGNFKLTLEQSIEYARANFAINSNERVTADFLSKQIENKKETIHFFGDW